MTAEDLGAAGAMTVLLKDALKPNLIQTLEGQPCLMHAGPFANIAHGNSSLIADLIGLKLGDYVITESGFGSDMGMEKLMDIVCRVGGLAPSAVVLVSTVRALKHHGGLDDDPRTSQVQSPRGDRDRRGEPPPPPRHRARVRRAVRRRGQPPPRRHRTRRSSSSSSSRWRAARSRPRPTTASSTAARAPTTLAEAVVDACEQPSSFRFLYPDDAPIKEKIEAVARRVYGAADVFFYPEAEATIERFTDDGLGELPVCMAKTHLSLSADPALLNAPRDFTLPVRDVRAYTGAGWLVPLCGDIQQMPGLGKSAGGAERRHRRGRSHRRAVLGSRR